MEFLYQYLLFAAEAVTIVLAIFVVLSMLVNLRKKGSEDGQLIIKDISQQYQNIEAQMQAATLDEVAQKRWHKQYKKQQKLLKKQQKQQQKNQSTTGNAQDSAGKRRCLFVLAFNGSTDAHEVEALRREITAVLSVAQADDQVVLKLESPGGVVHGYGLAASQLMRLRQKSLPFTVVVDKVAASGGYMMACTADKIIAAPFAIIGSIGVVAQIPNFHRLLKKNEIDVELQTAGKYKRTLTLFGENTEEGREKFKQELEEVHHLFKDFVQTNRPQLNVDEIATGEHWFGLQAKEKGLVDENGTSDDFIAQHVNEYKVVSVQFRRSKRLGERFSRQVVKSLERFCYRSEGVK